MAIHTLADLTGNGAAQALLSGAPTPTTKFSWIQFTVPLNAAGAPTNSATVRVGDSNVSATRGTSVPPGSGLLFPPIGSGGVADTLTNVYFYAAVSDKLQVTYGTL